MEAVLSHQDLQPAHGEVFLRNYFTKYGSKFSDSMVEECMNDNADANSLAVNVLMRYRPFEPEMVLQLFGRNFRQWEVSTHHEGKRDFGVPLPDADVWPNGIHMYMGSTWARGHISLLDFLRKRNAQGQIVNWTRRKFNACATATSLEDFAQAYTVKGEKIVAASTHSPTFDTFYGQWLVPHVPFHSPMDFIDEELLRKVPVAHRFFTAAMFCERRVAMAM